MRGEGPVGALRHPVGQLSLVLLAAALAAPGVTGLAVDNSPRAFFVRDGRLLGSIDELRDRFGGGPVLRMAWSGGGLWTKAGVEWLERVTGEAAALPGVAAAHGPLELADWWQPAEAPAEVERRLSADPLARAGGWVSADGGLVTVQVELEPGLGRRESRQVLEALERLAAAAPAEVEGVVVGLPVIERAMDRSFERLATRIFPAIVILCTLLLAAACRNLFDAALPLATVVLAEVTLLGSMGWAGARFNLITSILVPIVFVVGLANTTHLQMRFRAHRRRGLEPRTAASAALRDRAWAILWAGTTTAAAFGSFAFSRLPPVRALGLWTAAGVVLAVVATFAFQAPMMALMGGVGGVDGRAFDRLGRRLGQGLAGRATRRLGTTIVALALVGALAAAGLPRLALEAGLLSYFPSGHEVPADIGAVAAHGVGAAPAELVLRLSAADPDSSFRDPARLERLAELTSALRSEAPILGAVGAGDLFRAAGRRAMTGGPTSDSMRWLVLGLLQTEPEASRRFERMVTPDGRTARVTLLVPIAEPGSLLPAFERAAERARSAFPEARVEWTGDYPLVLVAQRDLLRTMAFSLGLTVLTIALVLALLLRSAALWAAAMAANLWPLLVTGGLMGWAGIPLDSTTVMIAAVALGIAVDDTLHTLGELRSGGGEVVAAIGGVAPAQLLTTVILVVGFAGCGLSDFLPVAHFGVLTAAALVAALAGDWLLLPALLGLPWRRSGSPT